MHSRSTQLSLGAPVRCLVAILAVCSALWAEANNLSISNVTLTGQNTASQFALVQFDIGWDNSWRMSGGVGNWDAAWVFVKYRRKTQAVWRHATLNWVNGQGTGDGHSMPTNAVIRSSNDNGAGGAHGVFIYRGSDYVQGSVSYTAAQLRWNYGADGVANSDSVEICVFGIEMVYVPQGSFELGTGGGETGSFYRFPSTANTYVVNSEAAISVGPVIGNLYYGIGATVGDGTGPIPAAFPKGFNAFYCMKYEITQDQYVNFLNKLTSLQDPARAYTGGTFRSSITGTSGVYVTTRPFVACNFMSWADMEAYLDWAALRPITELEFEKVCRGPHPAVVNEYAWGTNSLTGATAILNGNLADEIPSVLAANCTYNNAAGVQGPMRSGCFGLGVGTRAGTGSSAYGIMELSGNVWERPVSVGSATGRAFTGQHGDGVLTNVGDANTPFWPYATAGTGSSYRGGTWQSTATSSLMVSDRSNAANAANTRTSSSGGRGVRTAP